MLNSENSLVYHSVTVISFNLLISLISSFKAKYKPYINSDHLLMILKIKKIKVLFSVFS